MSADHEGEVERLRGERDMARAILMGVCSVLDRAAQAGVGNAAHVRDEIRAWLSPEGTEPTKGDDHVCEGCGLETDTSPCPYCELHTALSHGAGGTTKGDDHGE